MALPSSMSRLMAGREIVMPGVRYGYRRVHVLLRREGGRINQKKTRRIYRELGL